MAAETLWAEFLQRLLLGATLSGPATTPPQPAPGAEVRPAAAQVAPIEGR